MRALAALLASALCLAPAAGQAQVENAPITATQKHDAWFSLVRHGPLQSARAFTSATNGNALIFDYFPGGAGGCVIPQVSILVSMGDGADKPWAKTITGVFRIDQERPIVFEGAWSAAMGDKFSLIEISNVGTVGGFLKQVAGGAAVRFQIGEANSDAVERFRLLGAESAMRRAMQLCTSL